MLCLRNMWDSRPSAVRSSEARRLAPATQLDSRGGCLHIKASALRPSPLRPSVPPLRPLPLPAAARPARCRKYFLRQSLPRTPPDESVELVARVPRTESAFVCWHAVVWLPPRSRIVRLHRGRSYSANAKPPPAAMYADSLSPPKSCRSLQTKMVREYGPSWRSTEWPYPAKCELARL